MNPQSLEVNFRKATANKSKSESIRQTRDELLNQLRKQYKFLCRSHLEVSLGDWDETDRLALALRILFHNANHSHGLLSQVDPEIAKTGSGLTFGHFARLKTGALVKGAGLCDVRFCREDPDVYRV